MEFTNAFDVAGRPQDVVAVFDDVPLLASFLAGASVGDRNEDGSYPGQLTVAFGPKKLTFKGRLVNVVNREQLAGTLTGAASSDIRSAKMSVAMRYKLSPVDAGTRVDLVSEAELTGILAEFARTGGVVLTQALIDDFAKRLSEHMRATAAAAADGAPSTGAPASTPAAAPQALSAFALLVHVVKSFFTRHARPRA